MELIIALLFIVIIALILSLRSRLVERIGGLENEIFRLRDQLEKFVRGFEPKEKAERVIPERPVREEEEQKSSPEKWARPQTPAATGTPIHREVPKPPGEEATAPSIPTFIPPIVSDPSPLAAAVRPAVSSTPPSSSASRPQQPEQSAPKPGFFERHPDLEKFIGENLVSKIGIAILVLAIGFFVKYAIDIGWIGAAGRVGIGLLCGGILVAVAHTMRNSYKAFSSVLVGGGLAIFYFSIALAYHQYEMFGQLWAFIIMLVITAFAVLLSLLYNRQELAIIALVGGFVSPFIASNGRGDYKSLFIYLLVLNAGLLVIAYFKSWRLLNLLAFIFTALLFASWLITLHDPVSFVVCRDGLLFATLFYVLFFAINIAHTVRQNKRFIASDFGILLANTCAYFGVGLYLLKQMHESGSLGLFSASMAVFNLCVSYFLFRKKQVDTNILYLLIGITLSFISLTAPIQLNGHYITLFWASESVLLYWLYKKSGIRIIATASLLVGGAMLVSLVMDWCNVYWVVLDRPSPIRLPVVFNKGLMTTLYAAICCYLLFRLRTGKMKDESRQAGSGIVDKRAGGNWILDYAVIIIGMLLLFGGGMLEINHQFNYYYPHTGLAELYLLLYVFAWSLFVSYAAVRWNWFPDVRFSGWLLVVNGILYLVFIPDVYTIQSTMLVSGHYSFHFVAHWIGALLVAGMIIRLIGWLRAGKINAGTSLPFVTWLLCIMIVIFLSAETQFVVNQLFYRRSLPLADIQPVYVRAGLPVLWGLCSFGFMWMGMCKKFRPLRIISLCLFTITLLKLFVFDISDIPVGGKIAAFFCLGVLLLVVSFMYQRLRKILVAEDDEKQKTIDRVADSPVNKKTNDEETIH